MLLRVRTFVYLQRSTFRFQHYKGIKMAGFSSKATLRSKWGDLVENGTTNTETTAEVSQGLKHVVGWLKQASVEVREAGKRAVSQIQNNTPNLLHLHTTTLIRQANDRNSGSMTGAVDKLTLIHYNDVYNIDANSKSEPIGGAARFCTAVRSFSHLNPLVLFSGDAFSPSMLSTFTKGEQMIPVLNTVGTHCAVFGNHDFDHGLDILNEWVEKTNFPWLMSNVVDNETGRPLGGGKITHIMHHNEVKVGLIGLVEKEWLDTLPTIDPNEVTYIDFIKAGNQLADELHNQGCDIIIALTHMRTPNDIELAKHSGHIDLILGGHDHVYEILNIDDTHVIKSGTDFRQFSKIGISLNRNQNGKININVEKVDVNSTKYSEDSELKNELKKYSETIESKMDEVLGTFAVELDGRFSAIRTSETNLGNWICDVALAATGADCVIINSGTFRSDQIHPAGPFTMRDLINIIPMQDPLIVLEVTGKILHQALENSVSTYPKLEGRFPQIAGMSFVFDPTKKAGERVEPKLIRLGDEWLNLEQTYTLCVKSYIYGGCDGYNMFKECRVLMDDDAAPELGLAIQNHFKAIDVRLGKTHHTKHRQSLVTLSRRHSMVQMLENLELDGPTPIRRKSSVTLPKMEHICNNRGKLLRRASLDDLEQNSCQLAPTIQHRIIMIQNQEHIQEPRTASECTMSTINKLEIRGIRSFGVDRADVQQINFRSPLTLIVGQNGCGKTTIIECLKYGLTGEVPPGTNRGVGFVHDPKIFNTVESLGQVKLMVKDFTGNTVTAIRSMKITHKGKNPKFETMDSTITMENAQTKEKVTMTRSRVTDINNEMCDAMGVSKAILNNVIFCHQEDSCWPLEEPKELKKKFDAIFGTTEYNRVIDKLIKISKEYNEKLKEKQGDLKLLQNVKAQAESKQLQLEDGERNMARLTQMIGELEEDIRPIQSKLEQLALVERQYSSLLAKKIEFNSKIKSKHEQSQQLRSKINKLFEGSLPELEMEVRIFQQTSASKRSELEDEEAELQSLKLQDRSLQSKLQSIDGQKIELAEKQKRERELQIERGKKIRALGDKLSLSLVEDYGAASISASVVEAALGSIRNALKAQEATVQSKSKAFEEEDAQAQKRIDKLRETKATLESDCTSKRKQIEQLDREKLQTAREVAEIERSAETLKRLIDEIDRLEQEYETQVSAADLPAKRKELAERKLLRDQLQDQLDKLDERISSLDAVAMKEQELTLKEQQCTGREAELRRLRNKHGDSLRRLFPDRTIESNYKSNLQNLYDELQKEVKTVNEKVRRTQATVTEMETTRKSQKQQLDRLERELADAEEKIYSACRGNAYEEVLAKLNEKIQKNNMEHGEARSAVVLYQKFIANIENDRCCPVCEKGLESEDAHEVSGKLGDEIRRLPEKIETLERTLKKDRADYDKLLALKPISERLEKQRKELPQLKQQLQDTEKRLSTASDELEEYQLAVSEPTANMQLINAIVGDMSVLDKLGSELERMKRGVEELRAQLGPNMAEGVTIESLKSEREALRAKFKTERNRTDELQNTIDTKTEKLNNLQARNNQMKSKKLKLQESVQSLEQKRASVNELGAKIATLEEEFKDAERRLTPVRQQLQQELEQKQRSKEQNNKELQRLRKALEELRWEETAIVRLSGELDDLAAFNLGVELSRLQAKREQTQQEQDQLKRTMDGKAKSIEKLRQDIANQHLQERDLLDNRDLKRLMRETADLEAELAALVKSMGEMEVCSVQKERDRLIDLRDELQARRSELNGQVGELQRQLNELRKELNRSEFRNAVRNYVTTLTESIVQRKIISDIKKYRDALESALREYHTEKMQEINRTIFSLWRDIYRGNDIDYIRINTVDDGVAERSDKRRAYTYGVVQAKNDVEIDMRGRCSAGQKVLASLIIRLALAETFSSNCGVMALDEPTTNLDRDNIDSLCESLRRIVSEREGGHFLLIVITHDEEFVTKLEKFENYYRISRNSEGKSVIKEEQL